MSASTSGSAILLAAPTRMSMATTLWYLSRSSLPHKLLEFPHSAVAQESLLTKNLQNLELFRSNKGYDVFKTTL